jgi:ubiquinone/menaquinone biosynthesis C-methylase UbiE
MLAECRRKVTTLGAQLPCGLVQADVFRCPFVAHVFDAALVGFLVSHFPEEEEPSFFDAVRRLLRPGGRFLILDSAWTATRAKFNRKVERQERRLNDGTRFQIPKRYIDHTDIDRWAARTRSVIDVEYLGEAFIAASGSVR